MLARLIIAFRWMAAAILSAGMALNADAEKRAFIVGAGDYANITDLRKTVADADGYAALFGEELGFKVTRLTNPTRAEFAAGFGGFLETIKAGDEVVFIFSGHGWSDGAENYLVMTDAPRDASEYQLKADTTPITTGVLAQIKRRNPRLTFAIIDACREYPFDSFTMNAFKKGLVRTDVSEGMLVLYAAGSRQKALDRLSNSDTAKYSVFTRVLLPKLRQTNRPLQDIARDVKDEVRNLASTINHVQRPAYYDELLGDYCLSGTCRAAPAPQAAVIRASDETTALAEAMTADTLQGYLEFRARYPQSTHRFYVQEQINRLTYKPPPASEGSSKSDLDPTETALTVYSEQEMAPGTVFRDTLNDGSKGPEMVVIPAGSFMMGLPSDAKIQYGDEGPQRRVTIAESFAVGKFEVTWADWDACVLSGGCDQAGPESAGGDEGLGKGQLPLSNVTRDDAEAYSEWLSEKTGEAYRLLSEAEWEYSARAGATTKYFWGESSSEACEYANSADRAHFTRARRSLGQVSCHDGFGFATSPVGSFKPNDFGLYDMLGNVSEIVADCYHRDYFDAPTDGSVWTSDCTSRIVSRGGSWSTPENGLRLSARADHVSTFTSNNRGFRIARVLRD